MVSRRAAGGPRSMPWHHAGGSRLAPGECPRRRAGRRVPARQRHHMRTRTPVLRGRGSAHPAPPPPARRALPDLGGAQRLTRTRSSTPRPPSTSRPTAVPGSAGSDDHAGVDIGRTYTETPVVSDPRRVPGRHPPGERELPAASRAAPPSGRMPRSRWPLATSARSAGDAIRPRHRSTRPPSSRWLAPDGRGRRPYRRRGQRPHPRRRTRPARRMDQAAELDVDRGAARADAGGRLQPPELSSEGACAHERASQSDRDPRSRRGRRLELAGARRGLRLHPGHPVRARRGLPGA